ncbi:MAG TPA: hypothetical protein VLE22_22390 [Bryobacteraceae bacterium]|nr:hypothetical protein [Bryobacteraceae bacterium]
MSFFDTCDADDHWFPDLDAVNGSLTASGTANLWTWRACLFLSSEWSDGIIGQTINVDGGAVMK